MNEITQAPSAEDSASGQAPGVELAPGDDLSQQGQLPAFLLIIQDDPENVGHVNIGGHRSPRQFDPTCASHQLGAYIERHLSEIFEAARREVFEMARTIERGLASNSEVIGPDRERTLLLGSSGTVQAPGAQG